MMDDGLLLLGPNRLYLGSGYGLETVLWSTHVTFDFDLMLESFLTFRGSEGLFGEWGRVQKPLWGVFI